MVGVALQKGIGLPGTAVPHRGSGPVVADVAGGQVTAGLTGLAFARPMTKGQHVRIFAVTGHAERFNQALVKALADTEVKKRIADLSIEPAPTPLEQADDVLKTSARCRVDAFKFLDFVRP